MNQVILYGRLGTAPKIRTSDNGTTYARISLATNYRVQVGGQWEDRTDWHTVVAFGSLAESLKPLDKGSGLLVQARLQQSLFERDQVRFRFSEVIARRIDFTDARYLDSGTEDSDSDAQPEPPEPFDDDDIPF